MKLVYRILGGFLLAVLLVGCSSEDKEAARTDDNVVKIAAFNIQVFGRAKRENAQVMDVLEKIAREFDVMLVQEIRDSSGETTPFYLEGINEMLDNNRRYGYHDQDGLDL